MTDLSKITIASARDAMRAGELTSVELTQSYLDALAAADALNAYSTKTPEKALAQAAAADVAFKQAMRPICAASRWASKTCSAPRISRRKPAATSSTGSNRSMSPRSRPSFGMQGPLCSAN